MKYWIVFVIGIILFTLIRTNKRGFFWKDRAGNKLSFKEFLGRWKEGVEGITPLQQTRSSIMGIWIVMAGIISGISVNALIRMENQWWWIEVILLGSLILTVMQMIGLFQKYWKFKAVENEWKKLNKPKRRK